MGLLASLGLDEVSADPNDIADGKYDGIVLKDEFVLITKKVDGVDIATLSHVITYQVEDGDAKGAQKQQWYALYKECVDANGAPATKVEDLKGAKPALSDTQKRYYKKLFVDLLGIPEEQVSAQEPGALTGTPVTFGIKTNNGYKNVSFVERRGATEQAAIDPFASGGLANSF